MNPVIAESRIMIHDAHEFGRVAVMYGGDSSEREVSLDTGRAVLDALQSKGVDATGWDPAERPLAEFAHAGFDRVWIALHGPGGEDGAVQGALQWFDIPYTGSGVMASALAMDKVRSKKLFAAAGISSPNYVVFNQSDEARGVADQLEYPLFVKPSGQGSSVGLCKVFDESGLTEAVEQALGYGDCALAETAVSGSEFTVAVLQGQALPSVRIETPRTFYDYRAKYQADDTKYFCPGTDDGELEARLHDAALAAFAALGCHGWGRVDFMVGDDNLPQAIEVNTVPGMTSHSLVPMAARATGIEFPDLCWRILETSFGARPEVAPVGVAANDA